MSPSRMRRIHSSTPSTARWKDHSSTVGEHTEHGAMKMTAIVAIAVMVAGMMAIQIRMSRYIYIYIYIYI